MTDEKTCSLDEIDRNKLDPSDVRSALKKVKKVLKVDNVHLGTPVRTIHPAVSGMAHLR